MRTCPLVAAPMRVFQAVEMVQPDLLERQKKKTPHSYMEIFATFTRWQQQTPNPPTLSLKVTPEQLIVPSPLQLHASSKQRPPLSVLVVLISVQQHLNSLRREEELRCSPPPLLSLLNLASSSIQHHLISPLCIRSCVNMCREKEEEEEQEGAA